MMNKTFTINMLKTFKECPQKYEFLYLKKIQLPESAKNTTSGNNIHNLIDFYLKGQEIRKLENNLNSEEKQLWNNFLNLNLQNCIKSEYPFYVKINEDWLTGRIDALFKTESGYYIADWKTGKFRHTPNEQFQTHIYLYAIYNILNLKKEINSYSNLSMKYFILKDESEILVNLDKTLYNQIDGNLKKTIGEIQEGMFKRNITEYCDCCPYRSFCHYNN